jgi:biopolymer transport protein ExbB/TolQ
MIKKSLPNELLFTVMALLIVTVFVHSIYVLHVRPVAEATQRLDREMMATNPDYESKRSIYVVIKDYEQEATIILMFWALGIMAYKTVVQRRETMALESEILRLPDGLKILPEDTREYARQIESLSAETRRLLVPRALLGALARFGATRNVQDASTVAHGICQSEAERLDSDMALLRYIAWAIPAIGFIGTVRGIGNALSQAHKAVTGDISGVTEGLGVAFNSTLIALLLSIFLMFLMQQLQQAQERRVLDTETWLDQKIIRNLQTRG